MALRGSGVRTPYSPLYFPSDAEENFFAVLERSTTGRLPIPRGKRLDGFLINSFPFLRGLQQYCGRTGLWMAAVLAIGVLLRLVQYAANRSLWLDEASLALNFFDRGFGQLFTPLGYHQAAPAGF